MSCRRGSAARRWRRGGWLAWCLGHCGLGRAFAGRSREALAAPLGRAACRALCRAPSPAVLGAVRRSARAQPCGRRPAALLPSAANRGALGPVGRCCCLRRRRCCCLRRRPRTRRRTPTKTCWACKPGRRFPERRRQPSIRPTNTGRRRRPQLAAWASAAPACRWPSRETRPWATGSRAAASRTGSRACAAAAALRRRISTAPRASDSPAPRLPLRRPACRCHASGSAASAAASAAPCRRC